MALTRDGILGASDLGRCEVDVPEWGGSVFLQALSAGEMALFKARSVEAVDLDSQSVKDSTALFEMSVWVCVRGLVDAQGKRLFGDDEMKLLAGKNDAVIDRLAKEILRLSGVGATVADEKKS